MTHTVLIYNAGYDPETRVGELLDATNERHARGMIRRGVAEAAGTVTRGGRERLAAVALTTLIYAAWTETRRIGTVGFSTRGVFDRDHWTCAYCGNKVSKAPRRQGLLATVDHVVPQALGGTTDWWNLVAACADCNGRKADTPLGESGMRLRFDPYDPAYAYRASDGSVVLYGAGTVTSTPLPVA